MERGRGYVKASDGRFWINLEPSMVNHLDVTENKVNSNLICDLLDSWLHLLGDSPLNDTDVSRKPVKVFLKFQHEFLAGPLDACIRRYSDLADRLCEAPDSRISPKTGLWIPGFKDTPVFPEYLAWYRSGDPLIFRYLFTFLTFAKKVRIDNEELGAVAFRDWEAVEKRLSDLELDPTLTAGIAAVMDELVGSFKLTSFWPKFGPGRVSEPKIYGNIAKSNMLRYDAVLDHAFFKGMFSLEEGIDAIDKVIPDPDSWRSPSIRSGRVSRLRFVPKTYKTYRSICMEPNSYMYFQQGLMAQLVEHMRTTSVRRFVNLDSQLRNQELAEFGSRSGMIDTIDLSSASDSVSKELVSRVFPRELYYWLLATRTPKVRVPNGEIRSVRKFAPMGSALCFPVQCLVFTSVVIYASMQVLSGCAVGEFVELDGELKELVKKSIDAFRHKPFRRRPHPFAFEPSAIFGDDICVDRKLTPYVTNTLRHLGFLVNEDKSFRASKGFRESCGGFYLWGDDVKPLRFRVFPHDGEYNAKTVASLISGANYAGDWGYRNLRRRHIQCLLHGKIQGLSDPSLRTSSSYRRKNPIFFTSNRDLTGALYSTAPRNTHLPFKYNKSLMRDEYNCVTLTYEERIRPKGFETPTLERYLYHRWWGSRYGDVQPEGFPFGVSRDDTSGARLARRWIPREG